jgi:lipocalin
MKKAFFSAIVIMSLLLSGCFANKGNSLKPLETVHSVDLNRYVGQWYEISRYPKQLPERMRWQQGNLYSA